MVIIIEKLKYFLGRGAKNALNRKPTSLAAVGIVTATLILLGLFIAVIMNADAMMDKIGNSREINVYIARDGAGRSIDEIEGDLKLIDGVSDVRFMSREDRFSKVSENIYGEEFTLIGENPLRDSYILTITDSLLADGICEAAESIIGVEETIKNSDVLAGINLLVDGVSKVGLWLMLLMLLVSMYIIRNAIRLGIETHGDEIRIMRTIGATDGFITAPFVVQAVMLTLIGSLIAMLVCIFGYNLTITRFTALMPQSIGYYVEGVEVTKMILAVFPSIAILIGVFGSLSSVHKYLKKKY